MSAVNESLHICTSTRIVYVHQRDIESDMNEVKVKRPVLSEWVKPGIQKHADKYWGGDFTRATNHLLDIGINKVEESTRSKKEG